MFKPILLLLFIATIQAEMDTCAYGKPSYKTCKNDLGKLLSYPPPEGGLGILQGTAAAKTTATTTTVEYAGHNHVPIVILDNVLPEKDFLSVQDYLRSQTDFFENHPVVKFPGKIHHIDRSIVDPMIDAVLASKDALKHFPKEIFEQRELVRGFASVLCNRGWVHNDYSEPNEWGVVENELGDVVVAPAAVFYFGFDKTLLSKNGNMKFNINTGTAFYREIESGLESMTSDRGNETFCAKFPKSIVCDGDGNVYSTGYNFSNLVSKWNRFEETLRVVGKPNRLILYSKDVLHNAWVKREQDHRPVDSTTIHHILEQHDDDEPLYPCSAKEGRLAISLFFLSRKGAHQNMKVLDVLSGATRPTTCKQVAAFGACNWSHSKSPILFPWRDVCPEDCNLCINEEWSPYVIDLDQTASSPPNIPFVIPDSIIQDTIDDHQHVLPVVLKKSTTTESQLFKWATAVGKQASSTSPHYDKKIFSSGSIAHYMLMELRRVQSNGINKPCWFTACPEERRLRDRLLKTSLPHLSQTEDKIHLFEECPSLASRSELDLLGLWFGGKNT